jgi:ABC-type iron transport system FetAB ATPase subunit
VKNSHLIIIIIIIIIIDLKFIPTLYLVDKSESSEDYKNKRDGIVAIII